MGKFLNGLFVGLGVGLLIAPLKGDELRRLINERVNGMKQVPDTDSTEPIELARRQNMQSSSALPGQSAVSDPATSGIAPTDSDPSDIQAEPGIARSIGTLSVDTPQVAADLPQTLTDMQRSGVSGAQQSSIDDLPKPASAADKRRAGGGPVSS